MIHNNLDGFFKTRGAEMGSALPSDVNVTFEIEGEGGGVWTLVRHREGVAVHAGRRRWADSVLRCTANHFIELMTLRTGLVDAMYEGSVRVEGDMGLLVRMMAA